MMWRGIVSVLSVVIFTIATVFMYRVIITESHASLVVKVGEIRRIDAEAFRLVARARLPEDAAFALYERLARLEAAYVQRLAAREGKEGQTRTELVGSIAPLAEKILCDAMPQECVYLWKTFNDHRAANDPVILADTDFVYRHEEKPAVHRSTLNKGATPVLEEEQSRYDAMVAARTPQQSRAALIWYAGEGTRRTPGIIADLINGYLALDTTRSIFQFTQARAETFNTARQYYYVDTGDTQEYVTPPKTLNREGFPHALAALRASVEYLTPYMDAQSKKDLSAELTEARNALWWSGAYYEYAINDAMERTIYLP